MNGDASIWFSARTVFEHDKPGDGLFEERIVLFRAADFDEALERAEAEAHEYAQSARCSFTGYVTLYELADEELSDGVEVFSLMRDSDLEADDYITRFFDTGSERQGDMEEGEGDLE